MTLFKLLLKCLLISLLFSASIARAELFDPSWTVEFSLEPSRTLLSGTSLTELHEELSAIEIINCSGKVLSDQQCQQVADSGGHFHMTIDANQDGRYELWSIAVAKLHTGSYAKAIIIQDEETGGILQTLLVDSDIPGFSALYFHQGRIMWGMCLSCDVLADIVWGGVDYQVVWQPNYSSNLPEGILVDRY